jgi:hypothetical protein
MTYGPAMGTGFRFSINKLIEKRKYWIPHRKSTMIRIDILGEPKGHGKFIWASEGNLRGLSRQPLLDGCRALHAAGKSDQEVVGLYRNGRLEMSCQLGWGREMVVIDAPSRGPLLARYSDFIKKSYLPTGQSE